ncbi:MAG TPA: GNAT family N-acetyltransferase [Herpetosiphonaceae bacterium]
MTPSRHHDAPAAGQQAQGRALILGPTTAPGDRLIVRPARPSDAALLAEMLCQLSAETLWNRFGMALHPLGPEQARQLAERMLGAGPADWTLLLIAGSPAERIAGIAQLVPVGGERGEFALLLADDQQGRGLGRQLLAMLVRLARSAGLRELCASMRASNGPMLRLVRGIGLPLTSDTSGGETEVLLRLGALAPALASLAGVF